MRMGTKVPITLAPGHLGAVVPRCPGATENDYASTDDLLPITPQ